METLQKAVSNKAHIKFFINKEWNANAFGRFFTAIDLLYNFEYSRSVLLDELLRTKKVYSKIKTRGARWIEIPVKSPLLKKRCIGFLVTHALDREMTQFTGSKLHTILPDYYKQVANLEVTQLQYASPGFSDFTGIGSVVGHLKDLIIRWVEHRETREGRKIENLKGQVELDLLKIDRMKKFSLLLKEVGFSDEDVKKILSKEIEHLTTVRGLIESEQIEKIEFTEE